MSNMTKDNVLWRLKRGLEVYTCTACYVGAGIVPNVLDQACRHKQRERRRRLAAEANGEVYVPSLIEADAPATPNNKRGADTMGVVAKKAAEAVRGSDVFFLVLYRLTMFWYGKGKVLKAVFERKFRTGW